MKKINFALVILGCLFAFSACDKNWEANEFEVPTYTGEPANKTIQDIINVYTSAGHMDSICHAGETFIVKATVVSSDEGGNFYKQMVVQDETGAIQIQINRSGLCHTYPVGQTVYINCQGLVVDNYHGVYQIGWIYQGSVGRIDGNFLDQYLFKDGLPQEVTPIDIYSEADITSDIVCKLVRIHNCTFPAEWVGEPWSVETATTSRAIATINGNSVNDLVVRTSNYSKFRKALIPGGSGDLVGILSVYGSTYQLMLRTIDDVKAFGSIQEVFGMSFNGAANCTYTGDWFAYDNYMAHRNVSEACNDWLVSDDIPAATINGSTLYVNQNLINADAMVNQYFTICYTTNYTGDPNTTTWTNLPYTISTDDFYNAETGVIDGLSGNVRIAFHYNTPGAYNGRWCIRSLSFKKLLPNI